MAVIIGPDEKIAFIFDGGGCRAAYSVGMASALWPKFKDQIVYVQGVSAGALNAAKIVESGDVRPLETIWKNYIEKNGPKIIFERKLALGRLFLSFLANVLNYFFPSSAKNRIERFFVYNSLFSGKGLEQLAGFLDIEKLTQSSVCLDIITTDEHNLNQQRIFSNRDLQPKDYEKFRLAVIASASLMGAFPPVTIDNRPHSDGLIFNVELALDHGCTAIFVFYNNHIWLSPAILPELMPFDKRTRRISNIFWGEIVRLYFENLLWRHRDLILIIHRNTPQQLREITQRTTLQKGEILKKVILVGPSKIVPLLYILGFEKNNLSEAIAHGKAVGMQLIEELEKMPAPA